LVSSTIVVIHQCALFVAIDNSMINTRYVQTNCVLKWLMDFYVLWKLFLTNVTPSYVFCKDTWGNFEQFWSSILIISSSITNLQASR